MICICNTKTLSIFNSGFQGQLGLDTICKAPTPTLVQSFINEGLSIKTIFCGSAHNAAITHDGNVHTWGSNKGALGRVVEGSSHVPFTPYPGIVTEFGTIVNRIGRGLPRRWALCFVYSHILSKRVARLANINHLSSQPSLVVKRCLRTWFHDRCSTPIRGTDRRGSTETRRRKTDQRRGGGDETTCIDAGKGRRVTTPSRNRGGEKEDPVPHK